MINLLAGRVLLAAYVKRLRPVPRAFVEAKAREMAMALVLPPPKPDDEDSDG